MVEILNVVAISYDRPSEVVPARVEVQYVGQLRGNEVRYKLNWNCTN